MTINCINNLCANFTANAITADSITFDAGTNTMSSYTKGTWTPALTLGGGSTGITYSSQSGTYYRIGDVIYVSGELVLTSKGTDTGASNITGLPFTINNIGRSDNVLSCVNVAHRFTGTQFSSSLVSGTVVIPTYSGGGGRSNILDTEISNNSEFRFTLYYFTT